MKALVVGDVHAVEDELPDCRALIDGVAQVAQKCRPDAIVFLGDLYHNHKQVNVEVEAFWKLALTKLTAIVPVYAMVGNHDMAAAGVSTSHALLAHTDSPGVIVVDKPLEIDGVLMVPYCHTGDVFRQAVARSTAKAVICHQSLVGSKYENGFPCTDGASLEGFEDRNFVAGHIHTAQAYDKVVYTGSPRWRSVSDANLDKAFHLFDLPAAKVLKSFDASAFCSKLVRLEDRVENPLEAPEFNPKWRYTVDIHGDDAFIQARKPQWAGCRVRTFVTRQQTAKIKESMGIRTALSTYVGGYKSKYGTSNAVLADMVQQRLGGAL